MKNIIVSTLIVLVLSALFVFALSYGLDKNEQVECHKWQGYAYEKSDTGRAVVTITYYKNRVPSYFVTPKI